MIENNKYQDWRVITKYVKKNETCDYLVVNYKRREKRKLSSFSNNSMFKNCRYNGDINSLFFFEGRNFLTFPTVDYETGELISECDSIVFAHLICDNKIVGYKVVDYIGKIYNLSSKGYDEYIRKHVVFNSKTIVKKRINIYLPH